MLMHGFPDDLHLYDRLLPHLNPPRRVITFDFLGWGASDKPTGYPYTAANQTGDLDAVISQLGLRRGDRGGPRRLRSARHRLGAGAPRTGRRAGAAQHLLLHACPGCGRRRRSGCSPPRWSGRSPARCRGCSATWCFGACTTGRSGRFFSDPKVGEEFLPLLYRQFVASPSAHEAFFGLNRDLPATMAAGTAKVPRLLRFAPPGPDHLRRRRPLPEPPGGTALPPTAPDLGAVPAGPAPATTCRWTSPQRSPGCCWQSRRTDQMTTQATPAHARAGAPTEPARIPAPGLWRHGSGHDHSPGRGRPCRVCGRPRRPQRWSGAFAGTRRPLGHTDGPVPPGAWGDQRPPVKGDCLLSRISRHPTLWRKVEPFQCRTQLMERFL